MYMVFSPSDSFKPRSDFHKQILAHRDDVPRECAEVPSGVKRTDYDSLSPEQIGYYIWWRDCLRKGRMLSKDEGYAYLRIVEIAHSTDTFESALEQISLIRESRLKSEGELDALLTDLYIVNRHELPPGNTMGPMGAVVMSAMMASFPEDMDFSDALDIAGWPELYPEHDEEAAWLFADSLYAMDRDLLERTGSGISATYGERKVRRYIPFSDYYPEGGDDYVIEYDEFDTRFMELMKALLTYCVKKVDNSSVRVSSVLTPEMRRVVDSVAVREHVVRDGKADGWKGYIIIPASEYESPTPVIRPLDCKPTFGEPKGLRSSIIEYRDRTPSGPAPYVMCHIDRPAHSTLSSQELAFYLYFRQSALEGTFIDSDVGYLWLLLVDLINNGYDNSLEVLIGIRDTYFPGSNVSLPGLVAVEYALLKDEDLPDDTLFQSYLGAAHVMTQILEGRDGHMSADGMMGLANISHKTLRNDLDDDCVEVANLAIRRINREVAKRSSNGILSKCRLRRKTEKVQLFSSVKYYPANPRAYTLPITFIDYGNNVAFCEGMNAVLRTVVQAMRARRHNKKPSFTNTFAFGMDIEDVVLEVADGYLKDKARRSAKGTRDISIDKGAVDRAQDDLRDVTEMMAVDDDGEKDEQVVSVERGEVRDSDPWKALLSSLTDDERAYLEILSSGERPRGKRPVRRIEAINSKAMDMVGDTIIDDDGLIDDYAEDVRRMFGGSDLYSELVSVLSDDEREYLVALVKGPRPKGRRPVKRIESINSKASEVLGSELIDDGSVCPDHLEGLDRVL